MGETTGMITIPDKLNIAYEYLDRNIDLGRGEKIALYYRDETYSYSRIVSLSNKVGNLLRELGVEPENRVLLAVNDSPEFVICWYGIIKIGAVATDVYTFLHSKDYAYFLEYTRAKVLIVDEATLPLLEQAAGESRYLKHVLVIGKPGKNQLDFHRLLDSATDRLTPEPTHADDIALWKFTSGSTGNPKAVPLSHRNSYYNYQTFGKHILGLQQDDIVVSVPKLFFGYARDISMLYAFASGAATVLFSERSRPERIIDLVRKFRTTVLVNVPTMINTMIQLPDIQKTDFQSLKFCTSAGEALPKAVYDQWMEKVGVPILDCIGSCELCHVYISNRKDDIRPGSLGRMVPGYEAKIADDQGHPLPGGQEGILWVKGESKGLCYWRSYEKTCTTFVGEWVNTGDLFRCDSDGYYWFVGRSGDVLKVGGIFVSPLQIENCLLSNPQVKEAAVIGSTDKQGLVKPRAFVVVQAGVVPSPEFGVALQQYVKEHLAPYKYPRWVHFLDELPKDSNGKISKKTLKNYKEPPCISH